MRCRFHICDVFTARRFGGNQLAVLPDAAGLDPTVMQRIAREFNYSETTFVLPPEDHRHTRRVRIFTPQAEIPFAGHPNIGTAFVLAATGAVKPTDDAAGLIFEEAAGLVPVTVRFEKGTPVYSELVAPRSLSLGAALPAEAVARSLSLAPEAIVTTTHAPRMASAGLPFLFVELRDRRALGEAQIRLDEHAEVMRAAGTEGLFVYTRDTDDADLQARMFAPLHGVAEDPATGSAAVALAGLLAACAPAAEAELTWRIAQGIEMGRPSLLETRARKVAGQVVELRVGGCSVLVAEGWIEAGEA